MPGFQKPQIRPEFSYWKMILAETLPTRFNTPVVTSMAHERIISREQSLQSLKDDFRQAALAAVDPAALRY